MQRYIQVEVFSASTTDVLNVWTKRLPFADDKQSPPNPNWWGKCVCECVLECVCLRVVYVRVWEREREKERRRETLCGCLRVFQFVSVCLSPACMNLHFCTYVGIYVCMFILFYMFACWHICLHVCTNAVAHSQKCRYSDESNRAKAENDFLRCTDPTDS